jgi:hypothetical protein
MPSISPIYWSATPGEFVRIIEYHTALAVYVGCGRDEDLIQGVNSSRRDARASLPSGAEPGYEF